MRLRRAPTAIVIALTGCTYLVAVAILIITKAPLGSRVFFAAAATAAIAYTVCLARVWEAPTFDGRLFAVALGFALAFRIPLALAPVGADNDMVRYVWDGRVQLLGYNPYRVLPSDPALSHTHTAETMRMPSLRTRTAYPPAAQLFFRLVVWSRDSVRTMKLALVGCDLLTILVLWRWLVVTGRNAWLVLAYAWHPLVVLEVAHSGHIDALGALWITASAYWLTRRRTMFAVVAFVLALATKLLPIVLVPLFVGRIRARDAIAGALLLLALCLPFMDGMSLPLGAVPNVVAHIRFNGPLFQAVAAIWTPQAAAAVAVVMGLSVATWARVKWRESDPRGWAWPMAVALAAAPVVYPWYLLYFTPFLHTRQTFGLTVWTFAVLLVYVVWDLARLGGRWMVPGAVTAVEYGVVIAAILLVWGRSASKVDGGRPSVTAPVS